MATETQTQHQVRNLTVVRYLEATTAAEFELTVGFTARYVRVMNTASGDMMEWYEGMSDAAAIKRTASNGNVTVLTTLGITVSGNVVTVGLDTDVNVVNEQMVILVQG